VAINMICVFVCLVILSVKIVQWMVGNGYLLYVGRASQRQLGQVYGHV